jgi:DDE superfamily endonuclease
LQNYLDKLCLQSFSVKIYSKPSSCRTDSSAVAMVGSRKYAGFLRCWVVCLFFGKGGQHDLKLFQASGVHLHPETQGLQDKGYQGIQKLHSNSWLPLKKPKGATLSPADNAKNQALAGEQIGIEHVNRRFKIFRTLAERYRNRCRRYGLRCNLIVALYNYELFLEAESG